jgi:hypothetical protein
VLGAGDSVISHAGGGGGNLLFAELRRVVDQQVNHDVAGGSFEEDAHCYLRYLTRRESAELKVYRWEFLWSSFSGHKALVMNCALYAVASCNFQGFYFILYFIFIYFSSPIPSLNLISQIIDNTYEPSPNSSLRLQSAIWLEVKSRV